MSYDFNHFKVGMVKLKQCCFVFEQASNFIRKCLRCQYFSCLFLKYWRSEQVTFFKQEYWKTSFYDIFLGMHEKPADKEYFHLQICSCQCRFLSDACWNTKEILSNCCQYTYRFIQILLHKDFYPILCQFIWPFCFPAFHKAVKLVERM